MKIMVYSIFLLLSLQLTSCQSSTDSSIDPFTQYFYPEIERSAIKLGACQAGLTNTVEEQEFMSSIGVTWLRGSIPWSRVEKTPGVWDFEYYDKFMNLADKYNKKVLIVLAYDVPWIYKEGDTRRNITQDKLPYYLNYVKTIVKRYGKQAAGFEIWNEPNTPMFWKGSDDDFFELTKKSVELIKELLPDKPVAVGSIFYHPVMSGKAYLKKLVSRGILNTADAVSLHPYGLSIEAAAQRVADAERFLRREGYSKEIWITEFGMTTGGWYPNKTSVPKQANAVIESIVRFTAAGADLITWFKLLDGQMPEDVKKGVSSEEFFGLAYPDFSLKPSGKAYSLLAHGIQDAIYIKNGIRADEDLISRIEFFRFDRSNDSTIIIWKKSALSRVQFKITGPENGGSITNLITGNTSLFDPDTILSVADEPMMITVKGQHSYSLKYFGNFSGRSAP